MDAVDPGGRMACGMDGDGRVTCVVAWGCHARDTWEPVAFGATGGEAQAAMPSPSRMQLRFVSETENSQL
jgi:hypothetical protein